MFVSRGRGNYADYGSARHRSAPPSPTRSSRQRNDGRRPRIQLLPERLQHSVRARAVAANAQPASSQPRSLAATRQLLFSVRAFSVSVPTQRRRRRELLPAVLPAALRRLEPQRRAVQAVLQREYSARLHVLPGRSDRWPPGSDSPVEMLAQGDELLASARVGYVAKPTTPREANSLQEMGIPSMEDRMARTMDL